jgi:hypothetical protein
MTTTLCSLLQDPVSPEDKIEEKEEDETCMHVNRNIRGMMKK